MYVRNISEKEHEDNLVRDSVPKKCLLCTNLLKCSWYTPYSAELHHFHWKKLRKNHRIPDTPGRTTSYLTPRPPSLKLWCAPRGGRIPGMQMIWVKSPSNAGARSMELVPGLWIFRKIYQEDERDETCHFYSWGREASGVAGRSCRKRNRVKSKQRFIP